MTTKRKTTWRDIIHEMIKSKTLTPEGHANICLTVILLICVILTVVPTTIEQVVTAFIVGSGGKPPAEHIPPWLFNSAVSVLIIEAIACWIVIMKPFRLRRRQ